MYSGVSRNASAEEIKKNFRERARDVIRIDIKALRRKLSLKNLQGLMKALSDEQKRRQYDATALENERPAWFAGGAEHKGELRPVRPLSDGFTRAAQTFFRQNPQPSLNDAKHLFSAAFDTPAEADEFLKAAGRIAHNMALRAVKVIKSSREAPSNRSGRLFVRNCNRQLKLPIAVWQLLSRELQV